MLRFCTAACRGSAPFAEGKNRLALFSYPVVQFPPANDSFLGTGSAEQHCRPLVFCAIVSLPQFANLSRRASSIPGEGRLALHL